MSTVILTGFLSTVNGVAEQHFIIELDSDNRGIDHPAAVDKSQNTFMFKAGLNSYIGSLSKSAMETFFGPTSSASALPVGVRYNGNFFHDEYGGIEGDVPRGSFWFRLSKLPSRFNSREVKWVSFDGTCTSASCVGKPLKLLVAFVEEEDGAAKKKKRIIVTHPASTFDAETNDFSLVESTMEEIAGFGADDDVVDDEKLGSNANAIRYALTTKYVGKWSKTQQNEKFCGSFITTKKNVASGRVELIETGSFFTLASEVDLE